MRAKFINEKFIEDSDPITDMGIGEKVIFQKYLDGDYMPLIDHIIRNIPDILGTPDIPDDIINAYSEDTRYIIRPIYLEKLRDWISQKAIQHDLNITWIPLTQLYRKLLELGFKT